MLKGRALHTRIYVKGNLIIKSNLQYDTSGWNSPDDIPSLTFIVQGNIYIAHDATAIDGVYIAEQKQASDTPKGTATASGAIFTCTKSEGPNYFYSLDALYSFCNSQLVVHGRLLSNAIYWLRVSGSLNQSYNPGEGDPYATPNGTHAAELVISGPEDYVGTSSSVQSNDLQSITSLPPVL